jgi:hypothetical protein
MPPQKIFDLRLPIFDWKAVKIAVADGLFLV